MFHRIYYDLNHVPFEWPKPLVWTQRAGQHHHWRISWQLVIINPSLRISPRPLNNQLSTNWESSPCAFRIIVMASTNPFASEVEYAHRKRKDGSTPPKIHWNFLKYRESPTSYINEEPTQNEINIATDLIREFNQFYPYSVHRRFRQPRSDRIPESDEVMQY